MVKIDLPRLSKTVAAIFARHETDAIDWRRPHLGASLIGRECNNELWLSFRWATASKFPGRILRLFERGQREEDWLVQELRKIGVRVLSVDPNSGRQWLVKFHGDHFGGSSDGALLGIPEAPKTWHLFEAKTSNAKQFAKLEREGVKKAKPEHDAQMQIYMHGLGLKRALYMCVCKDNDNIYTERIKYDRKAAEAIVARAKLIIEANEPMEKISEDPTWWKCQWCNARPVCHLGEVEKLERNCRTCVSSTPITEGDGKAVWTCNFHDKELTVDEQKAGCDGHLFIPKLLPWDIESVNEDARLITYKRADGLLVTDTGNDLVVEQRGGNG